MESLNTVLVIVIGLYCLHLSNRLNDMKYVIGKILDIKDDISEDFAKYEEHNSFKQKGEVYIPGKDPMSEFNGQKDDWFGEENE